MSDSTQQQKLKLIGWQSWTHCSDKRGVLKKVRNYSPFGVENREIIVEGTTKKSKPPVGWNSWPQFMFNIIEDKILTVAKWIKDHKHELPLEYILIDDGWTRWGDWTQSYHGKFPNGMGGISSKILNMGLKPGLWIAPFLVDSKSKIFKDHPEWLARDANGKIVSGRKNYSFDNFMPFKKYLLNFENEEAYSYILDCFKTIILDWNIKLLKIDFTYAGHFNPIYNSSEKPDNMLRKLFVDIKNIADEVFIIGCGCPLFPAVGVVDAMRISDDIIYPLLHNLPLIKNFLHPRRLSELQDNFNARKDTSRIWFLDPDMFVCHPKFGLSEKQIYQFQKLVIDSKGLIFLGDYLPELTQQQIDKFLKPLFLVN